MMLLVELTGAKLKKRLAHEHTCSHACKTIIYRESQMKPLSEKF